jgi:hypothetical protein
MQCNTPKITKEYTMTTTITIKESKFERKLLLKASKILNCLDKGLKPATYSTEKIEFVQERPNLLLILNDEYEYAGVKGGMIKFYIKLPDSGKCEFWDTLEKKIDKTWTYTDILYLYQRQGMTSAKFKAWYNENKDTNPTLGDVTKEEIEGFIKQEQNVKAHI